MMLDWLLVLVVLGPGAHATVTPLEFATVELCQAAASTLGDELLHAPAGPGRTWARCVQRQLLWQSYEVILPPESTRPCSAHVCRRGTP